jgi:hypothetical protein
MPLLAELKAKDIPARSAIRTAEPPEPLHFQHSDSLIQKQIIQEFVGPGGKAFCLFRVFCGLLITFLHILSAGGGTPPDRRRYIPVCPTR